ncbi:hypothetical protein [Marinilabilia rubra]|uniref:Uncharacterized protein n=1 Tax=Marinilabilia rubra TaxID=2162893 RepID=A0A2U2B5A6_9BACT|nr:hypothetical protein [Marinilabilia rubra]PWD98248.1 hypothetical protein DDZ16_16575 [Marinilabilia rubra]
MSYPLHFFDEMVGELISATYTIAPPQIIKEKLIADKIEIEGRRVLRILRSEFYSSIENQHRSVYFEKVLKRLLTLKQELEELIKESQNTYITFGPSISKIFPELENFYSLYTQIHSFICIILVEFELTYEWVDKEKAIEYGVHLLYEDDLQNDFKKMVEVLEKDLPIPEDITFIYSFDKSHLDFFKSLTPKIHSRDQVSQIKEVINLFRIDSHMEFGEYVKKFIHDYIVFNEDSGLSFFYQVALAFLKGELKEIKEDGKRLDFILDFMLHTNLASDLTLKFISQELQLLEMSESEERVVGGLKWFRQKLEGIKETPRYQKFNISRINKIEKSTLDDAFLILEGYFERYGMDTDEKESLAQSVESSQSSNAEPKQIRLLEADSKKYLSEKIDYNGTADSLGLLFALFFESGLIKSKNQKARVARILSVSFNANDDSFGYDTILKAFKDPLSNQKSVKYIQEKLHEIKVQLAQLKAK